MARVLNRENVIGQLKIGSLILGSDMVGFTLLGGIFHDWTVRYDTVNKLLADELIYLWEYSRFGGLGGSDTAYYRWKQTEACSKSNG